MEIMLVNFVCLLACLLYICAIYLKFSKSENPFMFTKYVQNTLSWGNPLGVTRALADYSLGLMLSVSIVLSGVALALEALELGKERQIVNIITGLCRHLWGSRNVTPLQYSVRSPLIMNCPIGKTNFLK